MKLIVKNMDEGYLVCGTGDIKLNEHAEIELIREKSKAIIISMVGINYGMSKM